MQLPIKDGWWDALLALQNFSRSNKHWSKSCFVKLICYSKIWYFKIKLINIQSSLRSSLCALTWKFMFYVVLTKLKTHRRLTHHWHVQNSNKNRWQIKITEQLQWHFSNNFILLTGGFPKMAWKVTERIGFTIFSKAMVTCSKRFLRNLKMIEAVNFTFQCF